VVAAGKEDPESSGQQPGTVAVVLLSTRQTRTHTFDI
jgi:hypothetical protein